MNWDEAKKQLLEDDATREAYKTIDLSFEIGKMITDARILTRTTQESLAKKIGTKQPSIARIESGNSLPSLSFLEKIAQALGTELLPPRFEILETLDAVATENATFFYGLYNSDRPAVYENSELSVSSKHGNDSISIVDNIGGKYVFSS